MLHRRAALPLLAISVLLAGCGQRVEPGHVGIKVNLYGGNRGVQELPIVTGMVWYNPFTTTVYEYPTFIQTATWQRSANDNEELTFNSKEGLVISADVSLSYQLEATKAPDFYVQFRSDDIGHFTHGFFRNVARDAFNEEAASYSVEELYSNRKEEFLGKVRNRINSQISPYGIKLEQLGFIGAPRLPDNVMAALNGKIQAIQDAQRAQNVLQTRIAEANQAVAKADGEARANARLSSSLTPQLLQWRAYDIQERAIAKWNGALPTYSGQATPFISIPNQR